MRGVSTRRYVSAPGASAVTELVTSEREINFLVRVWLSELD